MVCLHMYMQQAKHILLTAVYGYSANESALSDYPPTAGLNTAIHTHINTSTANTGEALSWTAQIMIVAGGGGGEDHW